MLRADIVILRRFLTASWLTYLPDSPRTCAINQNLSSLLVRPIPKTLPWTRVPRGEKKHKSCHNQEESIDIYGFCHWQ